MSDTHFILTGVIGLVAIVLTMLLVYHFTRSDILELVASFVIAEIAFVILAMNSEGFFLWAMVIFFIPLFHFCAIATLAHRYDDANPSIREE